MTYLGRVQDGVVLVEGGVKLPEGVAVRIELEDDLADSATHENGQLTIGQKLAALARKYENLPCDLPEDLAINHDYYLHGLPKRQ